MTSVACILKLKLHKKILFISLMIVCASAPSSGGPEATAAPITANLKSAEVPINALFEPAVITRTGSRPEAVAIGDLNGDGLADVAMCTSGYMSPGDNTLFVFLQNGNHGLLEPVKYKTLINRAQTIAIGDFNSDGRNDIAVGGDSGAGIFYQNATHAFDPIDLFKSGENQYLCAGDFNSDGLDDIVTMNWQGFYVEVSLQNSAGKMDAPVLYAAEHSGYNALEVGDLNNDGRDDIVAMSGQSTNDEVAVLLQNATGLMDRQTRYDFKSRTSSDGIGIGDVTGDGRSDLLLSHNGGYLAVFVQSETGKLNPVPVIYKYGGADTVKVADINGDGAKDCISAFSGNCVGLLVQSSAGALAAPVNFDTPYVSSYNPQGLAAGDINDDGQTDVVTANYNSGLIIHYRIPGYSAADNSWILYR